MASEFADNNRAVLVLANDYQFARGQRVAWPRVESRMLVWCATGRGVIRVNGRAHTMEAEDFLFLPWAHAIVYGEIGRASCRERV